MADYLTKLLTLMNGTIDSVEGGKTSREIRREVIAELFSEATKEEKDELFDITERNDITRFLKGKYGDELTDEQIEFQVDFTIEQLADEEEHRRQLWNQARPNDQWKREP